MDINVDKAIEQAQPWALSLTSSGMSYPTVRLSPEKSARILSDSDQSRQERRDAVAEIFAAPRPDLSNLDMEQLVAIVSIYQGYIALRARGIPGAFAASIKSALENANIAENTPDRRRQ